MSWTIPSINHHSSYVQNVLPSFSFVFDFSSRPAHHIVAHWKCRNSQQRCLSLCKLDERFVLQCFGNEINIIKEYLFNQFVPCGVCASDLRNWLRNPATKQFTSEISCFHQSRNVSEAETKFHPNPISRNLASAFARKLISISFLFASLPGRDAPQKSVHAERKASERLLYTIKHM